MLVLLLNFEWRNLLHFASTVDTLAKCTLDLLLASWAGKIRTFFRKVGLLIFFFFSFLFSPTNLGVVSKWRNFSCWFYLSWMANDLENQWKVVIVVAYKRNLQSHKKCTGSSLELTPSTKAQFLPICKIAKGFFSHWTTLLNKNRTPHHFDSFFSFLRKTNL